MSGYWAFVLFVLTIVILALGAVALHLPPWIPVTLYISGASAFGIGHGHWEERRRRR